MHLKFSENGKGIIAFEVEATIEFQIKCYFFLLRNILENLNDKTEENNKTEEINVRK